MSSLASAPGRWFLLGALAPAAAVPAGCGYSLGFQAPPGVSTVAVPIFHNATFPLRREVEHDLTLMVRREIIARTSLRLVPEAEADLVLLGRIIEFREGLVVEGRRDAKVESNVVAVVDVEIIDHRNGYRNRKRVRGTEPFSAEAGESFEEARRRAIGNIAERIVAAMGYFDDYEDGAEDGASAEGN